MSALFCGHHGEGGGGRGERYIAHFALLEVVHTLDKHETNWVLLTDLEGFLLI